jgi:hypothetical protein
MVDAGPLIYLAKLDALDTFDHTGHTPLVTEEVERETARPGLGYEHPDSLVIADALRAGRLVRTKLTTAEQATAERLRGESGGIDAGEAEVLAGALQRRLPVLLFEQRATRLARSMGIDAWTPVRLLFAGTPDANLLRDRVLGFASLVQMRFEDVPPLLKVIEERER